MAHPQQIRKVGAHSNQETRPCDSSSPKPTVAPDSQPPTGRKRKHRTLSSEHQDTQPESFDLPEHRAKKHKSSSNSCPTSSSSTNSSWLRWDQAERKYWDSLSKVWLTPNALWELNRRNALLRANAPPIAETPVNLEQRPKNITHFARHGGPDLSDIRKYHNPEEGSSTSDSMSRNGKGKEKNRSSAYDGNFEQLLVDNYVFPPDADRAQRAANHADWAEVLIQPRASPSRSSDRSYKSFERSVAGARDEGEVMSRVFPKLVGNSRHASGQNVPFGHLEEITQKIVTPQPDWYQGEKPGIGNRSLRERLDRAIIPSTRKERPFLPTYFAEAKGPDGSFVVARRQACHDGALGARAIHSLQSLGGTGPYDGNAYAASAVYHGEGDLKLYTHHMTQPRGPGTPPHTHMNRIKAISLTDSPRSFREGRTAFRNVSDKTNEYRVRFIKEAKRRNGIVSPSPPRTVPRSTRTPLACQTAVIESSDSDPSNYSEEEDNGDGDYGESSTTRPKRKLLKPKILSIAPKRLAGGSPSPRPMARQRKVIDPDPRSSSEEESSRAPQRRQHSKTRVLTATPKRLARRGPSPPRRKLRPRRGSRRL